MYTSTETLYIIFCFLINRQARDDDLWQKTLKPLKYQKESCPISLHILTNYTMNATPQFSDGKNCFSAKGLTIPCILEDSLHGIIYFAEWYCKNKYVCWCCSYSFLYAIYYLFALSYNSFANSKKELVIS